MNKSGRDHSAPSLLTSAGLGESGVDATASPANIISAMTRNFNKFLKTSGLSRKLIAKLRKRNKVSMDIAPFAFTFCISRVTPAP